MRRGPLVVYNEDSGITKAMRAIPGVDTANVNKLNLLQLAPGGNFGRFIVWTEGALAELEKMYDTEIADYKKGYGLLSAPMENADLARIINSDEVQSALSPKLDPPKSFGKMRNGLKNMAALNRLNPYALTLKRQRQEEQKKGSEANKAMLK